MRIYKHVVVLTAKDTHVYIIFNKKILLPKFTDQKFPHLQHGGYIARVQDMVIIATATFTVASGHELLETIVAGHDPIM